MNGANYNTAVGYAAGTDLTEGDSCVFIGSNAGGNITTADKNTLIGESAGFYNATGDNMNIEKELRRNVKELQEQLQRAYGRIKTLQDEIHNQRKREYYNDYFSNKGKGMSGWAMMEEPPEYLEEGHKEFEYPIDKTENDV